MSTLNVESISHPTPGSNVTVNGITPAGTNQLGNRNLVINGDMRFDQRNAGAAVTINVTNDIYTLDRFLAYGQASDGVYTVQQTSTAPTGFTNSLKVTVTTADSSVGAAQYYFLSQRIEGTNVADLAFGTASAKAVTVSFWVRSSVTGTFSGALSNGSFNRSYPFNYTISAADTWEQKTVTIPGDTTGTWVTTTARGMALSFDLGCGSNNVGTANAWAGSEFYGATGAVKLISTLNATLYITGVQLEVGSVATPFEHRSYGDELARCQRYCFKWGNTGNPGNAYVRFPMGNSINSTTANVIFSHPVPMRDTARSMVFSASQIQHLAGGSTTGGYTATLGSDSNSDTSTMVTITNIGTFTADRVAPIRFYNDADAYVLFTAEL
jgi:hypothetical protein